MSGPPKTEFFIHDNGGQPFKIVLHANGEKMLDVLVGKWQPVAPHWDYSNHWKTFEYEEIFIGQGTYDSTEYCDFSYGNAVLILLKSVPSLQYVYIGSQIVQFTAEAQMEKFVSTVGNSDVPYSYARDKNGGHYFFQGYSLVDLVRPNIIPNDVSNGKPGAVYGYFYDKCGGQTIALEATVLHQRND